MNPNRSRKDEFKHCLDSLGNDARDAARCAYIPATIHCRASQGNAIYDLINRDAGFWNHVLGASQSAGITALGRIYDAKAGVLSARRLLTHVTTYPGLFSRAALQARKTEPLTTEMARQFAANSFAPSEQDFEALRVALVEHTMLYERTIEPIRHNVFAHSGNITREQMYNMFGNTLIADYHKLGLFALSLHYDLQELHNNGLKPRVQEPTENIIELVGNPLGNRAAGQWEHEHTVRETVKFLDHLQATSHESGRVRKCDAEPH